MKKIVNLRPELRSREGFTLIELLIYMGLLAIFLGVLTQIFVSVLDVRLKSEATSSIEQDGRFILARLMYDINRSDAIVTPASLGEQGSTLSTLVNAITYTYSQINDDLILSDNLGVARLNSSETQVSNLSFRRVGNLNASTLMINFTLTGKTQPRGGFEVKNFQLTVGERK